MIQCWHSGDNVLTFSAPISKLYHLPYCPILVIIGLKGKYYCDDFRNMSLVTPPHCIYCCYLRLLSYATHYTFCFFSVVSFSKECFLLRTIQLQLLISYFIQSCLFIAIEVAVMSLDTSEDDEVFEVRN